MVKAAVQKTISWLPEGHKVNYLFQKFVTKMRLDDAAMDQALVHCSDHVRHMQEHRDGSARLSTLELGTGWYAVVPIGMFLCGAECVMTVDLTPLLRPENLCAAIRKFREYHERGRLTERLPAIDAERLQAVLSLADAADSMTIDEILGALKITYIVADARKLELPDRTFDLIHSNDVFEHIYPDVLRDVLTEFKRVGKAGGLMSHFVDMSDHFFHFDKSISVYHFLRYTDRQWAMIDNSLAPQSRLRLPEYRALYNWAAVAISKEKVRPGNPKELEEVPLAPRFASMPKSDAAVTHAYIISELP